MKKMKAVAWEIITETATEIKEGQKSLFLYSFLPSFFLIVLYAPLGAKFFRPFHL
jgi:hypothetical protein